MKSSSRTRRFGDLHRPVLEAHFLWKNTTVRARLSLKISPNAAPATKKVTLQHHQILHLSRKMTFMVYLHLI